LVTGDSSRAEKWRPYRSLATSYLFSAAFEPAGAAAHEIGSDRLRAETTTTKGEAR
jgi:hypothetical protein